MRLIIYTPEGATISPIRHLPKGQTGFAPIWGKGAEFCSNPSVALKSGPWAGKRLQASCPQLLQWMADAGVRPDIVSYNTVLAALCTAEQAPF